MNKFKNSKPLLDDEQYRIIWLMLSVELYKLEEDPHGMTYMIAQVRSAKDEIEAYFKMKGVDFENSTPAN